MGEGIGVKGENLSREAPGGPQKVLGFIRGWKKNFPKLEKVKVGKWGFRWNQSSGLSRRHKEENVSNFFYKKE